MRHGLTALLLAALLTGCGAPPGVFRADRSSDLLTAPPLSQEAGGGVWIAPIAGAPAAAFRRSLAQALVARNVPAGLEEAGPLSLVLDGTPGRPVHAGRGYVDVVWRLTGPDGAVLDAFVEPAPLDFRMERPETRAAVDRVAARLAARLARPDRPAAPANPTVAVPPARTEGFEDGGPLARAMTAALAARGFRPDGEAAAAAVVRATASVAPAPGQDDAVLVTIRWAVTTPDGREVGAADQQNLLPAALAGDGLAAIAADAAAAAAGSVARLVRLAAQSPPPSTAKGAS